MTHPFWGNLRLANMRVDQKILNVLNVDKKEVERLTELFLIDGLTAKEQVELQRLLKTPENKDFFKVMYALWYAANFPDSKEDVEQALQRAIFRIDRQQPPKRETLGWFFSLRKLAAVWLIAFALGAASLYLVNSRVQENDAPALMMASLETKVIVPLGSQSQVELPDGTVVSLNAGSTLQYDTSFGQDKREVWLEGEGYFKVVKNVAVPFVVKAKDVVVKALGTEFNVKAYPEEKSVQTTLVNGLVTVSQTNVSDHTKEVRLKPKQTVTIYEQTAAEEQTVMDNTNTAQNVDATMPDSNPPANQTGQKKAASEYVELKDNIKTELYTSWKDPRWVIESEPLGDLALKLQRRFDVEIIIADESLKQYLVNGILTDETLQQVLDIMKSIAPINYSIRRKTVTLTVNPHQKQFFNQ